MNTPLSVDEVRNAIADPAAGGEVLFIGTVRNTDADKGVIGLAYSAHPSAEGELRKVTGEIVTKFPRRDWPRGDTPDWRLAVGTSRSSWACPAPTGRRHSTPVTR
ncbi:MAG TPA: molybdenum cofactor biosynthesis protein MoaE [Mycobacteriales bacterium]|jgi:molybdopterin synthase catalytic subunit|nr:molybdenum cofactor biosynthesis protein MoaE [Mycobacteriales bacterium]